MSPCFWGSVIWICTGVCVLPSVSSATQCQMSLEEALQIARQDQFGQDIDSPQRVVSGKFLRQSRLKASLVGTNQMALSTSPR